MIRRAPGLGALSPLEHHGLAVLSDLARLVDAPDDAPDADVVWLDVTGAANHDHPAGPRHQSETGDTTGLSIEATNGIVTMPSSLLREVGEIAGAAAEQQSSARDRFGRVPSAANARVAQGGGAERTPMLHTVADALRAAVIRAGEDRRLFFSAPWPGGRSWSAAFTHDVDVVAGWPLFTGLRLAELARKGQWALAARTFFAAAKSAMGDPVTRAVDAILTIEREASVRATWFFLCGTPTFNTFRAGDLTYRPESFRTRALIERVQRGDHEIALHGSAETVEHPATFTDQRARLAGLTEDTVIGVRQHFLRMQPGATQSAQALAGFQYDATYGFADRNGFRLGVADVVPAWDDARQISLPIDLVPLTWMDRALSKYQGIEDPLAWTADGLALAAEACRVGGLWVGLWHPNLDTPLGYPGALSGFEALVSAITKDDPWVATLEEIVAWRRARRTVRIATIAPDGRARGLHRGASDIVVPLVDATGRRAGEARAR